MQQPGIEKTENTRMCGDCKDKPTISPKHALCASCMARRANAARKGKKKPPGKPERKTNGKGRATVKEPTLVPISKPISKPIQIDFGKHISVLDEIRGLAEEEMRPLEFQILYMLKSHLKVIKEGRLPTN